MGKRTLHCTDGSKGSSKDVKAYELHISGKPTGETFNACGRCGEVYSDERDPRGATGKYKY